MAFPFTGAHSHAFCILLPSEQLSPSWSLNPFSSSRWRQTLVDPSPNQGKQRPFVRNPAQVFFRQRSSLSIRAQISKPPSTQKEGEGGGEATTLSSLPSSSTSVPSPTGGEPRARLKARMTESLVIEEAERPLAEYMSLPASQYSVLDAQRIERVDENTFRCYVYRVKFFNFEVCPVLLVRVDEQPNGCCIKLLSCTLEGSPLVVAQNKKFSASMINTVSWSVSELSPTARRLHSDATIEVVIEVPFAFRAIPIHIIEGTGTQVLSQLLKAMLPRFLAQLEKDYRAWASGDSSRQPLGTGEL